MGGGEFYDRGVLCRERNQPLIKKNEKKERKRKRERERERRIF
jgi:hypothetical protein